MTRIPEMVIFGLIQPIMFVVLFSYVFGGSIKIRRAGTDADAYREFLMAGIFAQTVTFATAGAGAGIADDMHKGLIDRFRSLPMARGAVLTGRTLADLVQTALTLVVLAVVALLVGWRIHDEHRRKVLGRLRRCCSCSGYAFSWIGALIGLSVRTPEAATSGGLIWLFPLTFISNAFVAASNMPPWLRHIAEWNPFSATVQACRELFGNPGDGPRPDAWPMQHPVLGLADLVGPDHRGLPHAGGAQVPLGDGLSGSPAAYGEARRHRARRPGRGARSGLERRAPGRSASRGLGLSPWYGLASRIFTEAFLPFGSSYSASSPTFLPFTPVPSGDCGEYVSMSELAYSREASRKVSVSSSSPSKAMVTTMPGATTPVVRRGLADLGVLQELGELAHAQLLLALLLLGRVVPAVLPQVALLAGRLDLLGDLGARGTRQVLQLGLELVVRLLGEPGDVLAGLGHRCSSSVLGIQSNALPRRMCLHGWAKPRA